MLDQSIMVVRLGAPLIPVQALLQAFPYPSYLKDDYVSGMRGSSLTGTLAHDLETFDSLLLMIFCVIVDNNNWCEYHAGTAYFLPFFTVLSFIYPAAILGNGIGYLFLNI